jgi:hypothetical protein
MEPLVIEGMDRLAARELKELFDAEGAAKDLTLEGRKSSTGSAGALDSVVAILSDPDTVKILLLTAWIVSNKKMKLAFSIGSKKFAFEYSQGGAKEVLTFLRGLLSAK